jgi:hypothetical protein
MKKNNIGERKEKEGAAHPFFSFQSLAPSFYGKVAHEHAKKKKKKKKKKKRHAYSNSKNQDCRFGLLFILVLPPFWPFYPCPSFIRSLLVLATL